MCALAPLPNQNWPLVHPIGYEQSYIYEGNDCLDSFVQFLAPQEEKTLLDSQSPPSIFTQTSDFDSCMVKKLNHNASERDRRKKVNDMYSSLRSLLPAANQTKLSFPATVSQALKYIPQLQGQVERLAKEKEEILLRMSEQRGLELSEEEQNKRNKNKGRCLSGVAVSMNRVNCNEVSIQVSFNKVEKRSQLSEILHYLEQQGFIMLNASSFESFGGMVFYNIHLQMGMETNCKLGSYEALSEKISALCDNREEFLL